MHGRKARGMKQTSALSMYILPHSLGFQSSRRQPYRAPGFRYRGEGASPPRAASPSRPSVVTRRGLDVRMACECLYRADVSASVEQIANEGAPPVVRAEGLHARLLGTPVQRVEDSLVCHPPQLHPPTLAHGREEGARLRAPPTQPGGERCCCAVYRVDGARLPPLARAYRKAAGLRVVVGQVECDSLGAPTAAPRRRHRPGKWRAHRWRTARPWALASDATKR
jgi:hypothetical protein